MNDKTLAKLYYNTQWETQGLDTQLAFVDIGTHVVLLFAGSGSKIDWIQNFKFFKKPYKYMDITWYAHGGIVDVWQNIEHYVLDRIKDIDKPLIISGYSHGGGIAVLCYEDLWFNLPEKHKTASLKLFAPLRVLGYYNYKKIAHRFTNTTVYRNGWDIVPFLPPALLGYTQPAKITHIGNTKRLFEDHKLMHYIDSL